jgi:HD superfamily phosphohydrolase
MADKVFRDPLYNYIAIDRDRDGWILDLLRCREVQRLRRIHQLGVSDYTYPGATHSRLAHSLGVLHLMQYVLNHLSRTEVDAKIDGARMRLLAAALLHDVGHGPFSHLFEPCLHVKHEAWSVHAVLDASSGIHKVLAGVDPYLPQQVADLIEEKNAKPPPWQKSLLSSQLDVDRLDYLRRDSLFTGGGYGHFDYHRLLTTVQFLDDDLVWPEKSMFAIEEYIFARFYMYQNVYLHKTTRGFEQLLQAMWRRAAKLRDEGIDVTPVPTLAKFWKTPDPTPRTMELGDYLAIEECTVLAQIDAWRTHRDKALSDLARRFLDRDGMAMVEPPPPPNPLAPDYGEWERAVHQILARAGYEVPTAYCLQDKLDSKYRQPYRPEKEPENQSSVNTIRIRIPGRDSPVEIASHLPRLEAVTKTAPGDQVRYYVPKEVRSAVESLRKDLTKTSMSYSSSPVVSLQRPGQHDRDSKGH